MIVLKKMRWSNAFSYAEGNEIDFSEYPLLQLVGKNGHGKTSIGLILEEALYNKNSKGVKKADIINRYNSAKSYSIEVEFDKDGNQYCVSTKRGSTQTVKLTCNGIDISSHTSTATYKQIEELLGMDHKTFAQIVILPSSSSLEFLTATDSTRKKFLIDLLDLSKYTTAGEIFKAAAKQVELQVNTISSKIESLNSWIQKNSAIDMTLGTLREVPSAPTELEKTIVDLKVAMTNVVATNKRITQNNQYKKLMDSLVVEPTGPKPDTDTTDLVNKKAVKLADKKASERLLMELKKPISECPTCKRGFPKDEAFEEEFVRLHQEHTEIIKKCETDVLTYDATIASLKKVEAEWLRKAKVVEQYEQYYNLYDPNLQTDLLDCDTLEKDLAELSTKVLEISKEIKRITEDNAQIGAKNARIEVISQQLKDFRSELVERTAEVADVSVKYANLQILVKTFGSSGLVAYKIECMVKDLEALANEYLNEISGGRFQLTFQISGSDKLNVVITDNGRDVDILALSSGERSRVNVATLLGIRKMIQALSNSRINLLFLDETMENLDIEGKERLVEILLKEEGLNTVLVSHSFTHPLIERVSIIKENNISRIE